MINFVVVDDNIEIVKKIKTIITKVMIKKDLEYKIHIFNDYDDKFKEFANKPLSNRIYFLDIETKSASGLDIARDIRKSDVDSILIFVTAHEELGSVVIREQLMALTFICKFDNLEIKIKDAIIKSLQILGKKTVIRFSYYNSLYTIPVDDILYVTRDSVERKCLIKTSYTTYKVGKNLSDIKELAGDNLIQTHRSCLVNESRISQIDKKNSEIIFDNGDKIDLLSNGFKKELNSLL